jgi:putative peptide zinc metalloprotease protein
MDLEDFPLPSLDPALKISRAPDHDGEPWWTLHHPASDKYFKIDWIAFECLSRFSRHKTADSLKSDIESNTTLTLSREQIADVVTFLQANSLVSLSNQKIAMKEETPQPLWKKALHGYLYFTVPLFRPQDFLHRTYPKISFLFSRIFVGGMMLFLGLMVLFTLPRSDEFFHTFVRIFSFEGAVGMLFVLGFVKIVHEWAHAYAAARHGVDVPHMGVAFMVMYPVLYTETSGSWRLSSRRSRIHIAIAGIVAELCLAAIFLAIWHIAAPGSLWQTVAFMVVVVSLVSSLLVNLNPLMRFDGYYLFSDLVGIDNLQTRSCSMARWKLREILFGLGEKAPEDASADRQRLLIVFGASLLVYRFFLFLGIALLVYHLFFQPLGLFLFLVEITWFILLPIWSELKVWWQKREEIIRKPRTIFPLTALGIVFLAILLPWKGSVTLPAILHAENQETIYPPAASQIISLVVEEGDRVKAGDILAQLSSSELDMKLKSARQDLATLEVLRARAQTNPVMMHDEGLSEAALEKARVGVETLQAQAERLTVRARFAGIVRDMHPDIQKGRFVSEQEKLMTIVDHNHWVISAYADEDQQPRISSSATAMFYPATTFGHTLSAQIIAVAQAGVTQIGWPELSSVYSGPVASDPDQEGMLVARRSLYEVKATLDEAKPINPQVQRGYLKVITTQESLFSIWINNLVSMIRREAKLG